MAPRVTAGGGENGVPSLWPPRRYGWVARFVDGAVTREIYDRPPMNRWEDVELKRLSLLELVDLWPTGEGTVLSLDLDEGTFMVRGRRLELAVGDVPLTERQGRYEGVVQYKQAHTDYRQGQGSETVLDAHAIGWARELPEVDARVLLRLDVATREVGIEVRLKPGAGGVSDPADVRVFLDGDRVRGANHFRELTMPGEGA